MLVPKFIKYKHDLPVGGGDSVLDVGCGFGDTAVCFAEQVVPGGRVVVMDSSSWVISGTNPG